MNYKKEVAELLSPLCGLNAVEIAEMLETPPERSMGDLALPCFKLARTLHKAPPIIAAQLSGVAAPFIKSTEVKGGYLNFFFDDALRASSVLSDIAAQKERYGSSVEGSGKVICIDYSSINIAKKCHIGHLSTTAIGNSLYKIYTFLGYKCVGINHLGDWGTQFGKLITAFKHWGSREMVETRGIDELIELYVKFNNEAEANPALDDEARSWFKRIEDDDPEATELFVWFKELTLRDVARVYDLLGVSFDAYTGESFYKDKWQSVVTNLRDKNLLTESEGAQVVPLDDWNMPPCIILKKDGASLYATRDLAAAIYRKNTYDFYKCLYVVAYQQNLHFKQIFKVLDLMGYDWASGLVHVPFGMVSFEGNTLSTRKGSVVYLEDLLNRAIDKAAEIIDEKNPSLENKPEVARTVGVGAVLFYDLYNGRIKDVDFWWDRALNFDGETGPYVQYTHARACSVLSKAGVTAAAALDASLSDLSALYSPQASELLSLLGEFPQAVHDAAEKYEPCFILRAVTAIAQSFNRFYYEQRIITDNKDETAALLALTAAAKVVIKTGLSLAGIGAPEKM